MRGVDARRTFLQYDCIFIEIALLFGRKHSATKHTGGGGELEASSLAHTM